MLDVKDAMLNQKHFDLSTDLTQREIEEIEHEVFGGFRDGLSPELGTDCALLEI